MYPYNLKIYSSIYSTMFIFRIVQNSGIYRNFLFRSGSGFVKCRYKRQINVSVSQHIRYTPDSRITLNRAHEYKPWLHTFWKSILFLCLSLSLLHFFMHFCRSSAKIHHYLLFRKLLLTITTVTSTIFTFLHWSIALFPISAWIFKVNHLQ